MSGDRLNLDALVEWAATERPETDEAVRALVTEVRTLRAFLRAMAVDMDLIPRTDADGRTWSVVELRSILDRP